MTREKLEMANNIAKEIERNEEELMYWQRSTGYHKKTFELDLGQRDALVFHFIPFEEMKERAIKYYDKEIEKLNEEFDRL